MASQTQPVTTTDVDNFVGNLFFIGAKFGVSPLLTMSLAHNGGFRTTEHFDFPMSNNISGDAPSQDTVTEDASIAAITATSHTPAQILNSVGIHNKTTTYSYASQALNRGISGVSINGMPMADARSPAAQREAKMRQLASNLEWSALRGTRQTWTNAATNGKTGGLVTAVEGGSETAAGGAALSKTLIDTEVARMHAAGAEFRFPVLACGAFQLQQINNLYGNPIESVTIGGVNLEIINLPVIGRCGLVLDPILADDDLVFVDLEHFWAVYALKPGKPPIFWEPRAKVGSGDYEALFTIFGIDFSNLIYHGMVSGLATS